MKGFIKKGLSILCGCVYVLGTLLESPFFFWKNRRLFENRIIYVFWQWSFGHTAAGLDYASRLYFPHRISLIYLPHTRSNSSLPYCFSHNMDTFIYRSRLLPQSVNYDGLKMDVLRFLLLLLSGLTRRFEIIEFLNIYKTLSLAEDRLLIGNNAKGSLEHYTDWTGYLRLVRGGIGRRPRLPSEMNDQCRQAILQHAPDFFDRPWVTLLLREKGSEYPFETATRSCGPQENYLPLVRYLTSQGYHVVGTGETNHDVFGEVPGYIRLDESDISPRILNLFVLMNCTLFIGQDSGPLVLVASAGIPCLVTDIAYYRAGAFGREDIVLFKSYVQKLTHRPLSIVDVYRKYRDLAYGFNYEKHGITILPNTADDLLEAGKEMVGRIKGTLRYSEEDLRLIEAFRKLPTEEMLIHYEGCRAPIHVLRQLRHELFEHMISDTETPGAVPRPVFS